MESVHEKIHQIFYDIDQRDELLKTPHFEQINEELMESIESSNQLYGEFREIRHMLLNLFSFPLGK